MGREFAPTRHVGHFVKRRPAVIFALLLALGIGVAEALPVRPWVWIGLAIALLLLAIFARAALRLAAAVGVTFFVGVCAFQIERYQFPSDSIWNCTSTEEGFAEIEVAVDQPPRVVIPAGDARSLPPKQTFMGAVRAVKTNEGWESASGKIAVTVEQPVIELRAGQIVRLVGMLSRPAPAMNPGEFDYAQWCRQQRILATFRVAHTDGVTIASDGGASPVVWLREKARHLLALGFDEREAFDAALLRAFVLGDSDPKLRDLDDKFVRTGTIHYLAISGLHVAIIGAIVLLIFRIMRWSPKAAAWSALAVVLLYGCVAEPSWPGWRSIILCTGATIGILRGRAVDSLQMFAFSVATVLLIHPADLGNGGFQVSLAAVLGLVLFSRIAEERFWDWWRAPDPATLKPHGTLWMISRWTAKAMVSVMLASFIAWAMAMPLIAYHFGQINGWAMVAGIVLLPLTIVALVAGVGKILFTLAWPSAAHACAVSSACPIILMRHIIEGLDRLPGASVVVPPPPVWLLIAYYGLILLLFVPMRRRVFQWVKGFGVAVGCGLLLLVPSLGWAQNNLSEIGGESSGGGAARIAFLSVGAGQCAVVRTAHNHATFFDDGSSTISDVGRELVIPWLRFEHCSSVDRIILSHGDFDHISSTTELLQAFNDPTVLMSPHFQRHAVGNVPAEMLLHALNDAGRPPAIIHEGDHLDLGDGVSVDVLWPPVKCDMNSNNCGLVLKLTFAGESVLFPADIQEPAERELLKHPEQLRADVLIAPHHGSAETTTGRFIAAVRPRYIISSNYSKLTHKQRLFDLIAEAFPLYRTSRCGEIDLIIDRSGQIQVHTFLGVGPAENKK
jgi:competence protein ComEC